MSKIAEQLTDLIGSTPMLKLSNYGASHNLHAEIVAKLEYFNPGGSVKDRIALSMVDDAERRGIISPGATLIEPTSGNTGIGLALVAAAKGYKLILTMPETMSIERRKILAALGAQIVLTPGATGMKGAIARSQELVEEIEDSVILSQFENQANPAAHIATTGPEILRDCDGRVDIFVAGVGTGGTVSGVGKVLKQHNSAVTIVAVEPVDSPVLSGGAAGPHKIQGIGAGFIPATYDATVVDRIMTVSGDEAFRAAREVARTEGLLVGISSGAALHAATLLAADPANKGMRIVVLLPDSGERYLSTPLFEI